MGGPGPSVLFIRKILSDGTAVEQMGLQAHTIVRMVQQVGFLIPAEVQKVMLRSGEEFAQDDAGGSIAAYIHEVYLAEIVVKSGEGECGSRAESVPGFIKIDFNSVREKVDDIRGAGPN